ncbi:MAG TPA: lysine--tRNA ligase, partial [Candidatus Cloacimonetes bacterium]|nr:lysine--tRNA ligase [Candidatus Cloacimonadota bacterium]
MDNENQLIHARKEKLGRLLEMGANPFPTKAERTHYIKDIFDDPESLIKNKTIVDVVGRIRSLRKMGKASFCHIEDETGKIQIYIKRDDVGQERYKIFKQCDLGDFVHVKGFVFYTLTNELSIHAEEFTFLAKAIRPLPVVKEKIEDGKKVIYDQFADKELRYRKRYLDLLLN